MVFLQPWLSSEARSLIFCLSNHLLHYEALWNNVGTGEAMAISRLVSIFAACICIKYQNFMASLDKTIFINCTKFFFFIIITVLLTVERAYI